MYIVKVIGDPIHPETTTYILQDENTHYIYEAQIELAANEAGSFDFTMRDDFPYWKKLLIMSSVIEVRTSEQEIIFRGRIRSVEAHGDYERAVYAEGELAYLDDTIQRPKSYSNLKVSGYLKALLDEHNAQTDTWKQIRLGNVDVAAGPNNTADGDATDEGSDIYKTTNWDTTYDAVQKDLVDTFGGSLRLRWEEENGIVVRYLDYFKDAARTSTQTIEYAQNLLSYSQQMDADEVVTVVIPLGKRLDNTDGILDERVTIASVNDGKDYLENTNLIANRGRLIKVVKYEDISDPARLKAAGQAYLSSANKEQTSMTLAAVDLSIMGCSCEPLRLLDAVYCRYPVRGLNEMFTLTKMVIDLQRPGSCVYTFGKVKSQMSSLNSSLVGDTMWIKVKMDGLDGRVKKLSSEALTSGEVIQAINGDSTKKIESSRIETAGIRTENSPIAWTNSGSSMTESGLLSANNAALTNPELSGVIALNGTIVPAPGETAYTGTATTAQGDEFTFVNGLLTGFKKGEQV